MCNILYVFDEVALWLFRIFIFQHKEDSWSNTNAVAVCLPKPYVWLVCMYVSRVCLKQVVFPLCCHGSCRYVLITVMTYIQ